jgi:hypothetical protein
MEPETLQKLANSLVESICAHVAERVANLASTERVVELQQRVEALEAWLAELEGKSLRRIA